MTNMLLACAQGSTAIGLVLLARGLFSGRLPRRLFMWAWYLMALRLLIPAPIFIPFGLWPAAGAGSRGITAAGGSAIAASTTAEPTIESAAAAAGSPGNALWLIWLTGSLLLLLWLALTYIRTARLFSHATPLDEEDARDWTCGRPLHDRIRLLWATDLESPCTFGLLRPAIALPASMSRADRQTREFVLRHELTHLRRLDPAFKTLLLVLCCLYWFDPLVWAMRHFAVRDMELSCDEHVARGLDGGGRRRYASLLATAASRGAASSPLISPLNGAMLKERIISVVRPCRMSTRKAAVLFPLLCLALTPLTTSPIAAANTAWSIETECFTFQIPASWDGRVAWETDGEKTNIYVKDHPSLLLLQIRTLDPARPQDWRTRGYDIMYSATCSTGQRIEVWAVNYAGMSCNNGWATALYSNPDYPGAELEQVAVDLATGGAYNAEELYAMPELPDDDFDFYWDIVAAGMSVK